MRKKRSSKMMPSKQTFVVTIYTDGMDYPRDMRGIAAALRSAVPDVVRPFVREVQSSEVRWTTKSKSKNEEKGKVSP